MKKILFLAVVASFCSFSGCEDDDSLITLPDGVLNYISANYPSYTIDESEQELACDNTTVYEVELEDGSNEIELTFDTESNFLYSEIEIKDSDLPTTVTSSISTNFPNHSLDDEADEMTMADGSIQYEVEVENNTEELEVILAADGTVLCQRVSVDED